MNFQNTGVRKTFPSDLPCAPGTPPLDECGRLPALQTPPTRVSHPTPSGRGESAAGAQAHPLPRSVYDAVFMKRQKSEISE